MSKRLTTIIIAVLCVFAIGASAYALAPMLLGDDSPAVAADAGGGQGTVTISDADTPQASGSSAAQEGQDGGPDAAESGGGQNSAVGADNTDTGSGPGSGGGGGGSGSSDTMGGNSSSNSPPGNSPNSNKSTTTSPPAPAPAQPTCTLSIDAEVMGQGSFMAARTVTFSQGESVFDVLQRECRNSGIPMEHSFNPLYNSVYVEGINNLYEFDGGAQSGWMYSVNSWYPNYGCSVYTLNDGDVIRWRYTKNLGADIGGSNAVQG
jgi:hypothetical protein